MGQKKYMYKYNRSNYRCQTNFMGPASGQNKNNNAIDDKKRFFSLLQTSRHTLPHNITNRFCDLLIFHRIFVRCNTRHTDSVYIIHGIVAWIC